MAPPTQNISATKADPTCTISFLTSHIQRDLNSEIEKIRIPGTYCSLEAAKAAAHGCLFDAGYEREWFSQYALDAPANIAAVFSSIQHDASSHDVGLLPWLAISLHRLVSPTALAAVRNAAFMREVGLKCISFNGIPRVINQLNHFHDSLPAAVASQLPTRPSRIVTPENVPSVHARGNAFWSSIYTPFADKLLMKLSASHPDLPVHILSSHYGALLSDFPSFATSSDAQVGRVLTSLVALACLRAQTGVWPQVVSHVFGLRKATEEEVYVEGKGEERGGRWLAGEERNLWILGVVDRVVEAVGAGEGTSFAPGLRAKLGAF
ncbi:hypothetical protein VF21_09882 [Pseudogymnoascus sp. 05NY08]|nr:hypothetical protein VF21_09882 [Pseudogymnoascus sp. 05NY08]